MPAEVSCSPPAELSEELGERSVAGLGSADSDMGILESREPHRQLASHQGSQVLIQPLKRSNTSTKLLSAQESSLLDESLPSKKSITMLRQKQPFRARTSISAAIFAGAFLLNLLRAEYLRRLAIPAETASQRHLDDPAVLWEDPYLRWT